MTDLGLSDFYINFAPALYHADEDLERSITLSLSTNYTDNPFSNNKTYYGIRTRQRHYLRAQ